jgi:hypothetical protein
LGPAVGHDQAGQPDHAEAARLVDELAEPGIQRKQGGHRPDSSRAEPGRYGKRPGTAGGRIRSKTIDEHFVILVWRVLDAERPPFDHRGL